MHHLFLFCIFKDQISRRCSLSCKFTHVKYLLKILVSIAGLEFTIEPSDVVVHEGNSVLLQCAGIIAGSRDGKTFPNIRWRGPDGQDLGIIGDTFRTQLPNGSLYISSVEENHGLTGPYQCMLSADGIGTIVSRFAHVSIASTLR